MPPAIQFQVLHQTPPLRIQSAGKPKDCPLPAENRSVFNERLYRFPASGCRADSLQETLMRRLICRDALCDIFLDVVVVKTEIYRMIAFRS